MGTVFVQLVLFSLDLLILRPALRVQPPQKTPVVSAWPPIKPRQQVAGALLAPRSQPQQPYDVRNLGRGMTEPEGEFHRCCWGGGINL